MPKSNRPGSNCPGANRKRGAAPKHNPDRESSRVAFLFDLDGTLVDSVYQHVLAWSEALEKAGIELSVWRIHRRIGMSGGLFVNALLRETGLDLIRRKPPGCNNYTPRPTSALTARFARFRGRCELLAC